MKMSSSRRRLLALALATVSSLLGAGCASEMTELLAKDIEIARVFEASKAVPPAEVKDAHAVAVLSRFEAAAVVGGSGGEGVVVRRLDSGWSPPLAVTLVSGTAGLQLGARGEQFILVFTDPEAVDRFVDRGVYSVAQAVGTGGDATGGPTATNDSTGVKAFNRAGGLFGSAALGGIGISVNDDLNRRTYGVSYSRQRVLEGRVEAPPLSYTLWQAIDRLGEDGPK